MTTSSPLPPAVGWTAIATGVVGLFATRFTILAFTVGGPSGSLNDSSPGLLAILSGRLAAMLNGQTRARSPLLRLAAVVLALIGALTTPAGSALVTSGRTGWFLAGLYMSAGFGAIGLAVAGLTYGARQANAWPRTLVTSGMIIGAIMALGLAAIPGILGGTDAGGSAPWYVN